MRYSDQVARELAFRFRTNPQKFEEVNTAINQAVYQGESLLQQA